jgi:hypothetical protein
MIGMLHPILKSRWFALMVHGALWLLLMLGITSFHGTSPHYHDTDVSRGQPQVLPPVAHLGELYSSQAVVSRITKPEATSPFYTRYFVPAPAPAPPPPPTTRKIEVTYLGFYKTVGAPKKTMVRMADAFVETSVGSRFVTNLFVAEATMQGLILTNNAGQTNLLPMNVKTIVEVPLK